MTSLFDVCSERLSAVASVEVKLGAVAMQLQNCEPTLHLFLVKWACLRFFYISEKLLICLYLILK